MKKIILSLLFLPVLLFSQDYLVDEYPDSLWGAYSLRLLNSAWADSPCIRIKNASLQESDIGFLGGVVDTAAITAFLTVTGDVTVWYDQSGNGNHLTSTNTPKIQESSAIHYTNGRAAIRFNSDQMSLGQTDIGQGNFTILIISMNEGDDVTKGVLEIGEDGETNNRITLYNSTKALADPANIGLYAPDGSARVCTNYDSLGTVQVLQSLTCDGSNMYAYDMGIAADTVDVSGVDASNLDTLIIGTQRAGNLTLVGTIQEIIIYEGYKEPSDRLKIETNMASFYNLLLGAFGSGFPYYMDYTNGDDTNNNGLSDDYPWKTLNKPSGYSFQVYDTLYLKRGDVYTDSLVVPDDSIYIGAYGSGDRPRLKYISSGGHIGLTVSNCLYFTGWTWDYSVCPRDSNETARADSLAALPSNRSNLLRVK